MPSAVSAAVAERLPYAQVNTATPVGDGIATHAYRVEEPSGGWVVRVSNDYPQPWTWRGGRRYEVPLLEALARQGVPVARDPCVVLAKSDGLPVAILEREVTGAPRTSPGRGAARDYWAHQLADLLTELHSFPVRDAERVGVPLTRIDTDYRAALTVAGPFLGPNTRNWVERQLTRLEQQPIPRAVIHRDFRAEHLYSDDDGTLTGIIDFGDTTIDDPAIDSAGIGGELGAPFLRLMLDHYRGPQLVGLPERIQLHQQLDALLEVSDPEGRGDRASAVQRLTARAAASSRSRTTG